MTDELKPCRDCGKHGRLLPSTDLTHRIPHTPKWAVFCDCRLFWDEPQSAIDAWNARK